MGRKLRVGVVFGGRSGEHEISIISARSVMGALDRDKYEVVPIGITREGAWLTDGDSMAQLELLLAGAQAHTEATAPSPSGRQALMDGLERGFPQLDVVFPVLHGPYGEDGTVQGMLEMADLPYVGAGVHGSALCMDKISCKRVLLACGLPVVDYVETTRFRWETDPDPLIERVEQQLGYPCFVKPANLGSSVGVSKAQNRPELRAALDLASQYDRRLLVEQGLDAREIEVGVLGNEEPDVSIPGEIIPCREFYDYEAKYIDGRSELLIPAPLPKELVQEIQHLAVRAYGALDVAGMARVDFLLDRQTMRPYLNELNTIPGFTSISMYPKLWDASGLPYPRLLDRLIELALRRHADRRRDRVTR